MSDVFISYSRKDIAFARLLHESLAKSGFETWIDWEDIPPSTDWLAEVYEAIESADTFVFVISGDSINSKICQLEIAHAEKNNKRLIPIVVNEVDPQAVHPKLAALNWIFFKDGSEFQPAVQALIDAIRTDQVWVKAHTRLQVRALEWERNRNDKSYLLRGQDLSQAEAWLAHAADKDPQPTALQTRYVLESRQNVTRRQRLTLMAVLAGLGITVVLGIFAWAQRNQAISEGNLRATAQLLAVNEANARATAQFNAEAASTEAVAQRDEAQKQAKLARAGFLSVESQLHLEDHLDLALLLSVEANHYTQTLQAHSSLLSALQYYPQIERYLHAHTGRVGAVAFKPDGEILVTAGCAQEDPNQGTGSCSAGEIVLWKMPDGQFLRRLDQVHTNFMSDLAFSSDGTLMASSDWGGNIVLWDTDTWQPVARPPAEDNGIVFGVEFYPDGKTIVSSHQVNMFDPVSGIKQISAEIRWWDTGTGDLVDSYPFIGSMGFASLVFNPDGKSFVTASNSASGLRFWDAQTHRPRLKTFPYSDIVPSSLAFDPSGELLALGGCAEWDSSKCLQGEIRLWDMSSDEQQGIPLKGHTDKITSLAFSPDGKTLASGSGDRTVILWDVAARKPIGDPLEGHSEGIASLAFSPGGKILASGADDQNVILWNMAHDNALGSSLKGHAAPVWSVAYSPDGTKLASAGEDGTIILRDMSKVPPGRMVLTNHTGHIYSLAFSPDGKILASGGQDSTVRLWDVSTGKQSNPSLRRHTQPVISLAFSPDGKTLASGSMDATIAIWNVESKEQIGESLEGSHSTVTSLKFSPDGHILASSSCAEPHTSNLCGKGEIHLWEMDGSARLSRTLLGHKNFIYSIDFSPDGKLLASGSADKTILIWDMSSGQVLGGAIEDQTEAITSLTFSPDGKTLASGSLDGSIVLMDVESRQTIGQPLGGHTAAVSSLSYHPDGKRLASAGLDGIVTLWDLDPESWLQKACQRAGRNLDPAEWAVYFPGEAYRRTCIRYE